MHAGSASARAADRPASTTSVPLARCARHAGGQCRGFRNRSNWFMNLLIVSLIVNAVIGSVASAEPVRSSRPITTAALHEADRVSRSMALRRPAVSSQQRGTNRSWIARHPKVFGALVGFGIGCALGASQVGGSEDDFFNALDEFACPVVGGIGAAAGAAIGALIK